MCRRMNGKLQPLVEGQSIGIAVWESKSSAFRETEYAHTKTQPFHFKGHLLSPKETCATIFNAALFVIMTGWK